jgi:coenzyme PQQ precursor peptide PqqA
MEWETPIFEDIDMSAEIGAYTRDYAYESKAEDEQD